LFELDSHQERSPSQETSLLHNQATMLSEELKNALLEINIQPNLNSVEEIRDEVVARLASLHPDKTGGQFADEEQQNDFQHVKQLLERIDQEASMSMQLVPLHQITNLIELIARTQAANSSKTTSDKIEAKEEYRRYSKRKYALPKITSAIFASLCFVLISVIGNFKTNPLYRSITNYFTSEQRYEYSRAISDTLNAELKDWSNIVERATAFRDLRGGLIEITPDEVTEGGNNGSRVREALGATSVPEINIQLDLFSTADIPLIKQLQQQTSDLNTKLSTLINKDPNVLFEELRKSDSFIQYISNEIKSNPGPRADTRERMVELILTPSKEKVPEYIKEWRLEYVKRYVADLQIQVNTLAYSFKRLESSIPEIRNKLIEESDLAIVKGLSLLIVLASVSFVMLWLRERSDERWLEYISSNEGIEHVFLRICEDKKIMSRVPPKFSLSEFTQAVSTKELPKIWSELLGKRLDAKHLGQISTALINNLKDRKVIAPITSPTVQSWFEIRVGDRNKLDKNGEPKVEIS
jgi:hypothetical protein